MHSYEKFNQYENTVDYKSLETPLEPNNRQQNKIISSFIYEDYKLSRSDVPNITKEQRSDFLEDIASGRIDHDRLANLVVGINTVLGAKMRNGESDELMGDLQGYENFKQIQGMILVGIEPKIVDGGSFKAWQSRRYDMGLEEVQKIVRLYRNPEDLENMLKPFMQYIRHLNGDYKYQEYQNSLRVFLNIVYGKRYEYSEQVKYLEREAALGRWEIPGDRSVKYSKAERIEKNPSPQLLRFDGFIEKKKPAAEDPKAVREAGAQDLARVATLKELLKSQNRVGYEIENKDTIHIVSIPQNPNFSDEDCLAVISGVARKIIEVSKQSGDELNGNTLKLKLMKVMAADSGSAVSSISGDEVFQTRSNIYIEMLWLA